jgi:dynein light chain LC8-type
VGPLSPSWHCIVGKSFTSVVTYESRHYIHFDIDDKSVILFKFG